MFKYLKKVMGFGIYIDNSPELKPELGGLSFLLVSAKNFLDHLEESTQSNDTCMSSSLSHIKLKENMRPSSHRSHT